MSDKTMFDARKWLHDPLTCGHLPLTVLENSDVIELCKEVAQAAYTEGRKAERELMACTHPKACWVSMIDITKPNGGPPVGCYVCAQLAEKEEEMVLALGNGLKELQAELSAKDKQQKEDDQTEIELSRHIAELTAENDALQAQLASVREMLPAVIIHSRSVFSEEKRIWVCDPRVCLRCKLEAALKREIGGD